MLYFKFLTTSNCDKLCWLYIFNPFLKLTPHEKNFNSQLWIKNTHIMFKKYTWRNVTSNSNLKCTVCKRNVRTTLRNLRRVLTSFILRGHPRPGTFYPPQSPYCLCCIYHPLILNLICISGALLEYQRTFHFVLTLTFSLDP